jgi:hypothetical protein
MANNIPTATEFEQASKLMERRHRNWSEIEAASRTELDKHFELHEFAIFPNDCEFAAILFFETNALAQRAINDGAEDLARDILLNVIKPFRADCANIEVLLEFDSHENVDANYQGNYFLRLR